jgi:hypothetical protein
MEHILMKACCKHLMLSIISIGLLAACGPSSDKIAATAQAQLDQEATAITAALPTATLTPTPAIDPTPTTEPTATPDGLSVPEVPDELIFRLPYWDAAAKKVAYAEPEMVTVHQDRLLPIPIGFLEDEEVPDSVLAELSRYDDGFEYDGNVRSLPLVGIVMSIDLEPSVPNGYNISVRTQTPGSIWFTVEIDIQNFARFVPVDENLKPVASSETNAQPYDLRDSFHEDLAHTPNATVQPGDMIVLRIFDADHWDHEDANSLLPRAVEYDYGISGGLAGLMNAIDKGQLDPSDGGISIDIRVSFENVIIVHKD